MPASSSYVDGLSVAAAASGGRPERREQLLHPLAGDDRDARRSTDVGSASRSVRCWTCSCMSATSSRETLPSVAEQPRRALGLVGVDVDLERALVADDQHGVADRLERVDPRRRVQPFPVTAKFVQ